MATAATTIAALRLKVILQPVLRPLPPGTHPSSYNGQAYFQPVPVNYLAAILLLISIIITTTIIMVIIILVVAAAILLLAVVFVPPSKQAH
jgi:hypothetical protein